MGHSALATPSTWVETRRGLRVSPTTGDPPFAVLSWQYFSRDRERRAKRVLGGDRRFVLAGVPGTPESAAGHAGGHRPAGTRHAGRCAAGHAGGRRRAS